MGIRGYHGISLGTDMYPPWHTMGTDMYPPWHTMGTPVGISLGHHWVHLGGYHWVHVLGYHWVLPCIHVLSYFMYFMYFLMSLP